MLLINAWPWFCSKAPKSLTIGLAIKDVKLTKRNIAVDSFSYFCKKSKSAFKNA